MSCPFKKWPFLLNLKSELLLLLFDNAETGHCRSSVRWRLSAVLSENIIEHHSCVHFHLE